MSGRDTIVDTILGMFTGRVDTTHQVTNPRITVDGDTARLTALVEAQHLLIADPTKHALLKTPTPSTWSATATAGSSGGCASTTPGSPASPPRSSAEPAPPPEAADPTPCPDRPPARLRGSSGAPQGQDQGPSGGADAVSGPSVGAAGEPRPRPTPREKASECSGTGQQRHGRRVRPPSVRRTRAASCA
ncbi:nuclear transport factor 2 family protein [Kitasatospora sp. NPDC018058]|uniref:nuclear transport factor 2 family protein n=1 Tax=Kitasatospora sp. NPDC018058 TaxID=3364025 RepID=UPI0037C0B9E2